MDRKKLENYFKEQEYRESLQRAYIRRRDSINKLSASYEGERVQNSRKVQDQEAEELSKLIDEMANEVNQILKNGNKELQELTKAINRIHNPIYKEILSMRYLEGIELKQIASKKNYEYGYLCKLHGRALLEFDKLC